MPHVLVRLLSVVLVLGQFAQVSGALFCERRHQDPSSGCDEGMQDRHQTALAPAVDPADALCAQFGACSAPAPAVTALTVNPFVVDDTSAAVPRAAERAVEFTSAPIPPPPQA